MIEFSLRLPLVIYFFCKSHQILHLYLSAFVENGFAGESAEDLMLIGADEKDVWNRHGGQ